MLSHVKLCSECIEICKKLIAACKECDYTNKTAKIMHQQCITSSKKTLELAAACLREIELHMLDCTNKACLAGCSQAAHACKECIKACQECATLCRTTGTDCSNACAACITAAHECIKACNKAITHACE